MSDQPHDLNERIAKLMGIQPRMMWRVWYDAEKQHGSIEIPTHEEAVKRASFERQNLLDAGVNIRDFVISEPEQYESFDHAPNYPNCPAAALTLIAVLAKEGWTVKLENGTGGGWECTFERAATSFTKKEHAVMGPSGWHVEQHYAPADTMPMAVSLAFVAAKEAK